MKKISKKQRERDKRIGIRHRQGRKGRPKRSSFFESLYEWKKTNFWIEQHAGEGLNVAVDKKRQLTLILPEKMNFFEDFDTTVLHINAIRKLAEKSSLPRKAYKLALVNLDNLRDISTSAALVLTSELSKWDDTIRQRLRPIIDNWDPKILEQFISLGFFDLFHNSPISDEEAEKGRTSNVQLVRYIKGRCGENEKIRVLKRSIIEIVGDDIKKWTFLHGGLIEAITNVTHHAYPKGYGFYDGDKNWYLTGSYDRKTKELKIVFFDQGIGIPRSLPTSDVWERALKYLSKFSSDQRKLDAVLLRAAVRMERSRIDSPDRGNGLQDLLEFIRQRKDGYISILSSKGLFKYSMKKGKESIKSESFNHEICGTLIIWSAILTG